MNFAMEGAVFKIFAKKCLNTQSDPLTYTLSKTDLLSHEIFEEGIE